MASNETKDGKALDVDLAAATEVEYKGGRCSLFQGNSDAKGFGWLGVGRGMMIMSNIFISASLLWLAKGAAGCDPDAEELCQNKVHGFVASVWVSNVPVITGVLSALFMPLFGAVIDFTPYRREAGILSASIITILQAIQIYTVEKTWFGMLLLQAVAVTFYQMQVVAVYAYLPDIARQVGEPVMNKFTAFFQSIQFTSQALFLVVIIAVQLAAGLSTVMTAQVSQGVNTVTCIVFFSIGWFKYLTARPAIRKLPEGHNIVTEGFRNNWNTAKNVLKFRKGMCQFFVAVCFAAAAASAITAISIIYLTDTLNVKNHETGIFFLVALLSSLPGSLLGYHVTMRTNPKTSYILSMFYVFVVFLAVFFIEGLPKICVFVWGFFVGVGLGWYYPAENLIFSLILPKGQEGELSGFYVYCTQIISWLPPLCFSIMVQFYVAQKYAVLVVASFFLIAVAVMTCTASWEEIVEEGKSAVVENTIGNGGHSSGNDEKDEALAQ